jgi:SSS family solute:Na+ symporter
VLVFTGIDGGVTGVWNTAVADKKLFQSLTSGFDIGNGTTSFIVLFIAFFFNALVPYTSGQDVVQRYVTTATEKEAARSLWVTMWMSIFGSMIFFGLGLALYAFYKENPAALDPAMAKTDGILPFFILAELPVGVAGLLVAAIFAAAQSTVSSSLNSVATAYVTDFHARVFRPDSSDSSRLRVAKIVVVIIGAIGISVAWVMAESEIESAFKAFNSLIGLSAGALGGLFALGVFNRRATGAGAVIGAVCGFGVVLALYLCSAPVTGLLYAFIGFGTCFIVGSIVSFLK